MATLEDLLTARADDIIHRRVTNRELAKDLGYSEEHISRTLKKLGIVRQKADERAQHKALVQARYEHRAKVAKTLPPKQAARAAQCSLRTIYRWRNK